MLLIEIKYGDKVYNINGEDVSGKELRYWFIEALHTFHSDYNALSQQCIDQMNLINELRFKLPVEFQHFFDNK